MSSKRVIVSNGVICAFFHEDLDGLNVQIECSDLANVGLGDIARKWIEFRRADAIPSIIIISANVITGKSKTLVGALNDADDIVDVHYIVLLHHDLVSEELKVARIACRSERYKGLGVQLDPFAIVNGEIINQLLDVGYRHLRDDLVSNSSQSLVAIIARGASSRVGNLGLGIVEQRDDLHVGGCLAALVLAKLFANLLSVRIQ